MKRIELQGKIAKANDEKRLVTSWLSVVEEADGTPVKDLQGDMIDVEVLREAAHEFMKSYRKAGEGHVRFDGIGTVVESIITDHDWQDTNNIQKGTMPVGWQVVVHIDDERTWNAIKSGELSMMSIGGEGLLEEVDE